jgi:hypothetical protein
MVHNARISTWKIWFYTLLIGLGSAPVQLFAQSANSSPSVYSNLNAGFGAVYGGLGGNLEVGLGHFSAYLSGGYATKRVVDNISIEPTVNWGTGIRYYFNLNNDVLFPRVGLGYGWITNYYNEAIGNQAYNQQVYGLLGHVGVQFYSTEGLVFNFDLGMGSKYIITNAVQHPFFYAFYIRPNIGIGYDLTRIWSRSKEGRTIKNKEINPFDG